MSVNSNFRFFRAMILSPQVEWCYLEYATDYEQAGEQNELIMWQANRVHICMDGRAQSKLRGCPRLCFFMHWITFSGKFRKTFAVIVVALFVCDVSDSFERTSNKELAGSSGVRQPCHKLSDGLGTTF